MVSQLVRRATLMLLFLFTFVSCQKSDVEEKNGVEEASTFEIVSLKEQSFNIFSQDEDWPDLKDQAKLVLSACIIDKVYLQKIVGESFQVETTSGLQSAKSNANGCISWKESLSFNNIADETYIKLSGKIHNDSKFLGTVSYNVAVNPWSKDIIFLKDGGTPQKLVENNEPLLQTTFSQLSFKQYSLFVEDFEFNSGIASLKLKLQTIPHLLRRNIEGILTDDKKLTKGDFGINIDVYQKTMDTNKRYLVAETSGFGEIDDKGRLISDITLDIEDEVYKNTFLEFVIQIKPINQDKLNPFVGLIHLSNLKSSTGGEITNFNVKPAFAKQMAQNNAAEKSDNFNEDFSHGFIIDSVRSIYEGVENGKNNDKNSMDEVVQTFIGLDIIDSVVFDGIYSKFYVELIDVEEDEVVWDNNGKLIETSLRNGSGHLAFDPKIEFDENSGYDYKDYIIRVTGKKDQYKDLVTERLVYINPRKKGASYIIDAEKFSKPEIADDSAPQIYFKEFKFEFNRVSTKSPYKINKNLDLFSERVINVELRPKLKLPHNFNGKGYPEIKTGEFEVSFLLLSPKDIYRTTYDNKIDLKDFYTISAGKNQGFVEEGKIKLEISLPHIFEDRVLMGYKNIAVLMVRPLDSDSKLEPGYIIGSINVLKEGGIVKTHKDHQLEDEPALELAQANKNYIEELEEEFSSQQNKLKPDSQIGDRLVDFKNEITKRSRREMVQVWDLQNYEEKFEEAKFEIFDDIDSFVSKSKEIYTDFGIWHGKEKKPFTKNEATKLVNHHDRLTTDEAAKLCRLFFDPAEKAFEPDSNNGMLIHGTFYRNCVKSPGDYVNVQELKFMRKILTQPRELMDKIGYPTVDEDVKIRNRSDAYFATKGEMFQEITGKRKTNATIFGMHNAFDFTGKVLKGPLGIFNAAGVESGVRYDEFRMGTQSDLISQQRRTINQDAVNYAVTRISAEFEAEFDRCVVITPRVYEIPYYPKQSYKEWYDNFVEGDDVDYPWYKKLMDFELVNMRKRTTAMVTSSKRYMVCDKAPKTGILQEHWYHVRIYDVYGLADIDQKLASNVVASTFRGFSAYNEFRLKDLEKDKLIIIGDKTEERAVGKFKKYMDLRAKNAEIKYRDQLGVSFKGMIE